MQTRPQPWSPGIGLSKNRPRSQWARLVLLAGLPAALSRLLAAQRASFSCPSAHRRLHSFPCSRVSGPLPPALALLSWPIPSPSPINSSPEAASPSTQSREDQVGSELYHAENFPSSLPLFFIFTFFCFLPTYGMGDLSSVTKNQTRDPCNGSAVS